jgi:3',5'-cyclic AMP phosphodiesterase CpdA
MGDNRGAATGKPSPEFLKLIDRMNQDSLAFVLNTGDMIKGYTTDRSFLRDQWSGYLGAVATLKAPMYHAPGNHDWFDAASAKAYLETVGPSFYSFDYGIVRLIALDTESDAGRIGPEQFAWLAGELETAVGKRVFVFLHRPLFPVDGHVGSSLDEHPVDRDRLHALFVKHKDVMGAVFAGHEHVYNEQVRDGIPYYITGGGGAPLYAAPEKGGYFHYLVVKVDPPGAAIELRRTEASASPAGAVPAPR